MDNDKEIFRAITQLNIARFIPLKELNMELKR